VAESDAIAADFVARQTFGPGRPDNRCRRQSYAPGKKALNMLGPDRPRFVSKPSPASQLPDDGPAASGGPPSPQQLAAVRQFIAQVGGVENARAALELLAILSAAGQSQPKNAH
jgi:hypothetical protein